MNRIAIVRKGQQTELPICDAQAAQASAALPKGPVVLSKDDFPFEVVIEGPGFRQSCRYATEEQAYTEARRIRDERTRTDKAAFRTTLGYTARYAVGRVMIQRWNPVTQRWASHAQPWSRNRPAPDALTPLPRDWHGDALPADWYASPAT